MSSADGPLWSRADSQGMRLPVGELLTAFPVALLEYSTSSATEDTENTENGFGLRACGTLSGSNVRFSVFSGALCCFSTTPVTTRKDRKTMTPS